MQAMLGVLHHSGSSPGFDWVDVVIGLGVLAVLGGIAFAISKMVQRRREDD